jgi:hypothetical protein
VETGGIRREAVRESSIFRLNILGKKECNISYSNLKQFVTMLVI